MKLEHIKDLMQSCNINFMIGSGLSRPYLSTLNNIETLLTDLAKSQEANSKVGDIIKASLYKKYFEEVMLPNHDSEIENRDKGKFEEVLSNYKEFLLALNEILLHRYCRLHNKQVNIFTTNIDLFLERAIEQTKIEFNDGFKGRMNPEYDLSNFLKSYSKTSLHYENTSEIPVFNLLKVHGSIDWCSEDDGRTIKHSNLKEIEAVEAALKKVNGEYLIKIINDNKFEDVVAFAKAIPNQKKIDFTHFFSVYNRLLIVNPTKEKFQKTLFDQHYYELMRMYANMLEKENSLLFAMGFSFADEHIRDITIRAANSNPTLQIIVFSYSDDEKASIEKTLGIDKYLIKNSNIKVVSPSEFIDCNAMHDEEKRERLKEKIKNFDFKTINSEVFCKIKNIVGIVKKYE